MIAVLKSTVRYVKSYTRKAFPPGTVTTVGSALKVRSGIVDGLESASGETTKLHSPYFLS